MIRYTRTLVLAASMAVASLAVQCTTRSERPDSSALLVSGFVQRLLQSKQGQTEAPVVPEHADGVRRGAWALPPQTNGCGSSLIALDHPDDESTGLDCHDFQHCLSAVLDGVQNFGISRGNAALIRIDAMATQSTARSQPGSNGLGLRFEERVQDAGAPLSIYTAHIVLLPQGDATIAATLITKDTGESYECFDTANRVFTRFVEGLGS